MSTRTTTQSYGSKIGDSFKGIIGGFFAIILSIGVLWWNESNSVKEIRKIDEGKKNTISIANDKVDAANEGLLVHLSGPAVTLDTLVDPQFGFSVNAIKLKKVVEMYQYKENKKTETKDNVGGSTTTVETFTYEEIWSEELISSDEFYESWRKNPKDFDNKAETFLAEKVTIGAFDLSEGLIEQVGGYESFPITEEMYQDTTFETVLASNKIYFGSGTKNPTIGDERVSFEVAYPHDLSIIAKQKGNSFEAYVSKNGRTINLCYDGIQSADEMYASEAQKNKILTWVLRFAGFFIMFAGFAAILRPIAAVGSVLPFLGNVLEAGTGLIAGLLAFIISFVIIAVAWIFYRPILGVILLAVAGGAFYFGKKWFGKEELPSVKKME